MTGMRLAGNRWADLLSALGVWICRGVKGLLMRQADEDARAPARLGSWTLSEARAGNNFYESL